MVSFTAQVGDSANIVNQKMKDEKQIKGKHHRQNPVDSESAQHKRLKRVDGTAVSAIANVAANNHSKKVRFKLPEEHDDDKTTLSQANIDQLESLGTNAFIELEITVLKVKRLALNSFNELPSYAFYMMQSDRYYIVNHIEELIEKFIDEKKSSVLTPIEKCKIWQQFNQQFQPLWMASVCKKTLNEFASAQFDTLLKQMTSTLIEVKNNRAQFDKLLEQMHSVSTEEGNTKVQFYELFEQTFSASIKENNKAQFDKLLEQTLSALIAAQNKINHIFFQDLVIDYLSDSRFQINEDHLKNISYHLNKLSIETKLTLIVQITIIIENIASVYSKELIEDCCSNGVFNFPDQAFEYAQTIFKLWMKSHAR